MSDGTWRVIGIAQTPYAWGIPFHHIDWLLADPNIDGEDILPCHDATGAFTGGASCGTTPSSPDTPSGQWDRGANACHTDAVLPMSNLCPPAIAGGPAEPGLRAPLFPPGSAAGCRAGGAAPLPLAALQLLMVLLVRRRRGPVKAPASLRLASAALAPLLSGCPGEDDGGGPGGTLDETAGDDGCVEPQPPVILPSNPDFRGITSGLAVAPSAPWRSIARGHVDDAASSTSCCEDYVLGSDASPTLSVVFGAAANGFAVFGDQPNVELDAGGNVRDVALADLDGDDRSDLVALLDGQITVRLGVDAPPFFEDGLATFSTAFNNNAVGRDQIVATDIDCDGAPDMLLPSDGGVVVMLNDGSGQLSPASSVPSSVSLDWVAAGDLDHDDDTDVVASASDGTVQVWIGNCGAFDPPAVYGNPQPPGTYEHTRVALGVVCPSFTSLAIAFSYGDTVDVYCGGGSGDFSNVQELHHEETPTGADFQWQPDTAFAAPRYADLAVAGAGSQQVLGLDAKDGTIVALVPSTCRHRSSAYSITMPYPASLPSPLSRLVATPNPSAWGTWDRLSMVGGAGLQVIR